MGKYTNVYVSKVQWEPEERGLKSDWENQGRIHRGGET